ncbi:MAG TPA: hypothetical protein VF710_22535 [Longimicrobium sp.]|jgi:hypothetical protein
MKPEIDFDVEEVTLNFATGEMEIRGRLRRISGPPPEVVWVWSYFLNPDVEPTGSWSGAPIKLLGPLSQGDEATLSARGHFHWWNNQDVPRNGYYAHVSVSPDTGLDATVPVPRREYTLEGAVRVRSVP